MFRTRAAAAVCAIFAVVSVPILAACGGGGPSTSSISSVPVRVAQPPTAADVAQQLHGTHFVPHAQEESWALWGMTSGGTFWLGGEKYAVNTFATTESRDRWLKVAKNFGVNPRWMTPTAVIYHSLFPH